MFVGLQVECQVTTAAILQQVLKWHKTDNLQCKVHLKNPTLYGVQRSFLNHKEIMQLQS